MKRNSFYLIIVLLILISCCHKGKDITKKEYKTIEVKARKSIVYDTSVTEKRIYRNQFGGITEDKNEFYIIDYLSQQENKKILLKIMDIQSNEVKKTVTLMAGTYKAPNEFSPPIGRISCFNEKYYVFNYKVSIFNEKFDYQDCCVIRDIDVNFLDYLQIEQKLYLLIGSKSYEDKGIITSAITNRIAVYELNAGRPVRKVKIILDEFKNISRFKTIAKEMGKTNFYMNYFAPQSYGFTLDNSICYGVNTRPGFFVYNLSSGEKRFIKLSWLKPKTFTDRQALDIGTFKTRNLNDKKSFKARGFKAIYKSCKENKLYFLWLLKGSGNTVNIITDIDTKESKFKVDVVKFPTGELLKRFTLPYGQHFTRMLFYSRSSIPQFYIDHEKGIYIYGDRDEDWNELVRYCRFEIKK